jgi:hypothetical protein
LSRVLNVLTNGLQRIQRSGKYLLFHDPSIGP